jgi:uncharacterized delta-60 repeat protein
MLNNSINYSNLISAGAISNSLNNDNLFVIGVRNQQFGGDYKPVVVEWSTILNEVLSNIPPIPPIPEFDFYNAGDSGTSKTIDWSNGVVQDVNLSNPVAATPVPLSFTNPELGKTLTLLAKQQLSGQRSITWPNNVIWSGGLAPTLQNLVGAGSIDSSYVYGTGFNNTVRSSVKQNDEKIIYGGDFTLYNGVSLNRIARLNTDGTVDATFSIGTGFNSVITALALQSDNKILAGGFFSLYNGNAANGIIRLNSNGSIDNTFNVGTGLNASPSKIVLQSDGKILVLGSFTSYNGTSVNRIVRLNTDGSIDNTFAIGTGFNGPPFNAVIDSNGKIIIVGNITSYNGTSINYIVRLNSNGSIDNSFNTGTGFDFWSEGLFLQTDNKVIVAGYFEVYNGVQAYSVIRLNPDGTIDTTFNPPIDFFQTSQFSSVVVQPDDKVILAGSFNTPTNNIIRLNSDGSVDNSFNVGSGTNGSIRNITLLSDGTIVLVGFFSTYDSVSANGLVKLIGNSPLAYNTFKFDYNGAYYIGSY